MSKASELKARLASRSKTSFEDVGRKRRATSDHSGAGHNKVIEGYSSVGGADDLGAPSSIDPSQIWWSELHDRSEQHTVQTKKFEELLESIESVGQRDPGRVRRNPNPDNPEQIYELTSGLNRLLVAKKLGTRFKAFIQNIDVFSMLVEKHAENTGRNEISLLETAHHVTTAYNHSEEGKRYVLEARKLNERTIYRYKSYSNIPINFFPDWLDLNQVTTPVLALLAKFAADKGSEGLEELRMRTTELTQTLPTKSSSSSAYLKALANLIKNNAGSTNKPNKISLKVKAGKTQATASSDGKFTTIRLNTSFENEQALKDFIDGLIKTAEGK